MKAWSKILSNWKRAPASGPAASSLGLGALHYRDRVPPADPSSYSLLQSALNVVNDDPARFMDLCRKQCEEAPDLDLPYMWLSNVLDAQGDVEQSIRLLIQGLESCQRVSGLLCTLGKRYVHAAPDSTNALTFFTQAVLAQLPSHPDYTPYLYLAAIYQITDYGNAAKKALAEADKIMPSIALTHDSISEVRNLFSPSVSAIQVDILSSIQVLVEYEKLST